jgi:hypothetical protein
VLGGHDLYHSRQITCLVRLRAVVAVGLDRGLSFGNLGFRVAAMTLRRACGLSRWSALICRAVVRQYVRTFVATGEGES